MNFIRTICLLVLMVTSHALATRQQRSISSVINDLKEQRVAYVNFIFTDLLGSIKEVIIPIAHAHNACLEGIAFDGSSVAGCSHIATSDMLLIPDVTTTRIVPWLEGNHKTAIIICDIYQDAATPFAGDPRSLLKKHIAQAARDGYDLFVGPELEFFFVTADGKTAIDPSSYCDAETNIARYMQKTTMLHMLNGMNINIEKLHHEVATGQHEVVIHYGSPLETADQIVLTKYTLKSVAHEYGFDVNFMPKPITGENGSALHMHMSLWDIRQNRNAFHDPMNPNTLSLIGQRFITGVLKHMPECCLIFNPSVNSFKRLVPGYEAPIYICWGNKNRSALVRVPQTIHAQAKRAELRNPDPLCNPYLAFTALLATGLKGVNEQYTTTAEVTTNLYTINAEQRQTYGITALPSCLSQAITSFEESITTRDIFGSLLVDTLVALKKSEFSTYQQHISSWEYEQYHA